LKVTRPKFQGGATEFSIDVKTKTKCGIPAEEKTNSWYRR